MVEQEKERRIAQEKSTDSSDLKSTGSTSKNCDTIDQAEKKKQQSGRLLGIFWGVFQCSSVVGGAISFAYYFHTTESNSSFGDEKPTGSTSLFLIFLAFMVLSAGLTQLLLSPDKLVFPTGIILHQSSVDGHNPQSTPPINEKTCLLVTTQQNFPLNILPEERDESWKEEAKDTLLLFTTERSMQVLAMIFLYTGFNQPYQQATFTRFFTKRTVGLELIIFHAMEIFGAMLCGRLLDHATVTTGNHQGGGSTRQTGSTPGEKPSSIAIQCLVIFFVVNTIGNIFAIVQELESATTANHDGTGPSKVDISSPWTIFVRPSLSFLCWGFADAQIQVYCYWLMGKLFHSNAGNLSRAVACYKCLQSLGYSMGFYFIPPSRLSPMRQILLSSGVFLVGTLLSFLQLPT